MGAIKNDGHKPQMDLVPYEAVAAIADALQYGVEKYGRDNYLTEPGLSHARLAASVLRHMFAYTGGQRTDPESGLQHVHHAIAALAMLVTTIERFPEQELDQSSEDVRWFK